MIKLTNDFITNDGLLKLAFKITLQFTILRFDAMGFLKNGQTVAAAPLFLNSFFFFFSLVVISLKFIQV